MSAGILSGLFLSAFLSATLLPGSSEVALLGVLAASEISTSLAIFIATIGNSLGSCVNWAIGRYAAQWRHHRWFPVKEERVEEYAKWYAKWGVWSLLASWVPVIGDPLTVMAGIARTPLWLFLILVAFAKATRYIAVAGLFQIFW